jgi:hypothetical protein
MQLKLTLDFLFQLYKIEDMKQNRLLSSIDIFAHGMLEPQHRTLGSCRTAAENVYPLRAPGGDGD